MEKTVLSVSDALALVNQTLDYAFPVLVIEGEVSSFKVNQGKYVFFDVKDAGASLGCFMTVWQLRMPIEDGMKVRVVATPKLTQWGKFSLTVREVLPVGEGNLKHSFEMLKAKLEKEGLFDPARKRPLPHLPQRIGVIASVESAGYVDFLTILSARWGGIEIDVAHVQVQGAGAPEQIIRAIEYFNGVSQPPEILVIVRGGGSADDLAVFNDEPLTRAVAASRVPTLVGIGHEVDVSLVDLVADRRAATPSNAAELLVPDRRELLATLGQSSQRLGDKLTQRLEATRQLLETFPTRTSERLQGRIDMLRRTTVQHQRLLEQLSPTAVLQRGYALIRSADSVLLRGGAIDTITVGDQLQIETQRAILKVGVQDVRKK
ncbi:MAG TPA: exodeoxyribonuclease VII large subunit [Candidatus Saccharimonadales bacterium]|jgi:exodeoxyribonuclease VII large subunit|nr:exodeoxyribonuclease VII large subunit [Candidatus Saccharimonadales bacterium]